MRRALPLMLLLLSFAAPAPAQDGGSLFVFQTDDEVRLRWNAPLGREYEGFHVERRAEPGGEWQRLTPEPVPRIADTARIRSMLGPSAESFLTFFEPSATIGAEEWTRVTSDPMARGLIGLLSVKNPAMARVMGERFDDPGLQPGVSFTYRVLMLAPSGGESVWATAGSPVIHGKPEQVPKPDGLRGEGGESLALLGWDHDDDLSRSGERVAYRIERSLSGIGPYAVVSRQDVVPTRIDGEFPEFLYTDPGLVNGTPYWYRITGVNLVGAESLPTDPIEVTPRDRTPPPPPTGLEGRALHGRAVLKWRRVEVDDLAGYSVYRSPEHTGPFRKIAPSGKDDAVLAPAFFDAEMKPGEIFWYFVTSLDTSDNESRPSDLVQVFLEDTTPPAAPTGVEAVGGEEGIRLTWEAGDEEDLSGYLVERSTSAEGPFFALHADPLDVPGYLDPVPEHSQTEYAYRVVSIDSSWNRSSASDVVLARRPDAIPPAPPALHSVSFDGSRVVLEWGRSSEPDLAGYRVYRSDDDEQFEPLGEELIAAATTSYRDRPEGGKRHFYRMTALDSSYNESDPTQSVAVLCLDLLPPDPPAGFTAVPADGAVVLQWQAPTDSDWKAIVLYRSEDGRRRLLVRLEPDRVDFTDRRAKPGVTYTYTAHSIDDAGNMSEPSEPAELLLDVETDEFEAE